MKVVDLNLLIYAVNSDAPHHQPGRDWWEEALSEPETVGLSWSVVLGFLRLSTRPGLFPQPLTVEQAATVVEEWLGHPVIVTLAPGDRHWQLLRGLLEAVGAAGNLTTDAHLAALAIEYDATLYSTDGDFARFGPPLRFINPLG